MSRVNAWRAGFFSRRARHGISSDAQGAEFRRRLFFTRRPRHGFPFRPLWTKKAPAIPVRQPWSGTIDVGRTRPHGPDRMEQTARTRPHGPGHTDPTARTRPHGPGHTDPTARPRPHGPGHTDPTARTRLHGPNRTDPATRTRSHGPDRTDPTAISEKTSSILSKINLTVKINEVSALIFPKSSDSGQNHENKRRNCF